MDGDNVGLQLGMPDAEVSTLLLALEVTEQVLSEAGSAGAELIVTHHPLIYRPLNAIDGTKRAGALVSKAIRAGLTVISAHTNLDCARYGVSETLAQLAGLEAVRPLIPSAEHKQYKLVTFVPENDLENVRRAIGLAGAGRIGEYRFCTFRTKGVGSFMGGPGSQPTIGEAGRLDETEEFRLETVVARDIVDDVVNALITSHSYEEVAYDLYPLSGGSVELGLGRVGPLAEPVTAGEFVDRIKTALNAPYVLLEGDRDRDIRTVAVCGGSGGSALDAAIASGADLFLTGELGYHDAQRCQWEGMCVAVAGHFCTEQPAMQVFEEMLAEQLADVNITLSEGGGEPYVSV